MNKVGIFCTDALEEIECLTVVDYLRRANIDILMISITGRRQIMGSHQIHFIADKVFEDVDFDSLDGIILPGGAGTRALEMDPDVCDVVREFYDSGRMTAAICAAPGILANMGILDGKNATMYPGMEPAGCDVNWTGQTVEIVGNVITGKGPGAAGEFALAIIGYLAGSRLEAQIRKAVLLD